MSYDCGPAHGDEMELLKRYFPKGEATIYNFVLFSTSGVHGSHMTIENVEDGTAYGELTFLIIQPMNVEMIYGNLYDIKKSDIPFLKKLRESSKKVVQQIG